MSSYQTETLRLIDALPPRTEVSELGVPGECPLAFDASGTKTRCFEATALDEGVARALHNGESWVDLETEQRLTTAAGYRDRVRMSEYARCLLKRASGECHVYDAVANRERTSEEAIAFVWGTNDE